MQSHGVPWQALLAQAFGLTIASAVALLLSLGLGLFGWLPTVGGLLLILALAGLLPLIPMFMNLSRGFFGLLLGYLGVHVAVTLLSYSFHYWHSGIVRNDGVVVHAFRDCLYFSITTWTTLGYGDFAPTPTMRLVTSLEALTGLISAAIGASLIWLWCTEHLVPKEMAFFDGSRRHKNGLSVHRMRIRTITGRLRDLGPEWVDPPRLGETFRYDGVKKEWVSVEDEAEVQEGGFVMRCVETEEDPTTDQS